MFFWLRVLSLFCLLSGPRGLKDVLNDDLSEEELGEVPTSFDVVGDIALIKFLNYCWEKSN